jgi:hypothetical protein
MLRPGEGKGENGYEQNASNGDANMSGRHFVLLGKGTLSKRLLRCAILYTLFISLVKIIHEGGNLWQIGEISPGPAVRVFGFEGWVRSPGRLFESALLYSTG